jgi:hypothetical protein
MDASPPYAKSKLARELREVLGELKQAELAPANLKLLEGIEQRAPPSTNISPWRSPRSPT